MKALLAKHPDSTAELYVDDSGFIRMRHEDGSIGNDTLIDGTATGQIPYWNGSKWAPSAIAPLYVAPMDWTTFIGIVNANAYVRPVQMGAGTWTCGAEVALASGAHIIGGSGVTINSTLTNNADPAHAVFTAGATTGTSGTLAGSTAVNATTFTSTAVFAIGDYVRIDDAGFIVDMRTITSKAGGPTFTYGVDRPLLHAYTAPAARCIKVTAYPRDILIDGRGMTITGTGSRFIELATAVNCRVRDVAMHLAGTPTMDIMASFDVGGIGNSFERVTVTVDSGATALACLALESNESSLVSDCVLHGSPLTTNGCAFYDCTDSEVRNLTASGMAGGCVNFTQDGSANVGCLDCRINGVFASGAAYGVTLFGGTSRTLASNINAQGCTTAGVAIGGDGTACKNNRFVNTTSRGGPLGVSIAATCTGTQIHGIDVGQNHQGILSSAGMVITGVFSDGDTGTYPNNCLLSLAPGSGESINVLGVRASQTTVANVILTTGAGRCVFDGMEITGPNGCNMINAGSSGGSAVANTKLTSGGGGYAVVLTGGTVHCGNGNDFTGCTSLYSAGAGTLIQAQSGYASIPVTAADVTLTHLESLSVGITTTGLLDADHNVILPTVAGMTWDVFCNNTGAHTTTFKTAAGTGIVVAQGKYARLACDGTNIVRVTADT